MTLGPEGNKDIEVLSSQVTESASVIPTPRAKVFSYQELNDRVTFSKVMGRVTELSTKGELTEDERAEYDGMYPAYFKQLFDPI